MKKLIALMLCCLVLTACAQSGPEPTDPPTQPPATQTEPTQTEPTQTEPLPTETHPPETEPELVTFTVYRGNENADGFVSAEAEVQEITEAVVIAELIKAGAIPDGVAVNTLTQDGTQLNIDLNQAFLDYLFTMGTSGEKLLIGSIVNTFLSAYGAESVMITVDGEIVESGHVIYDFPLTFVE